MNNSMIKSRKSQVTIFIIIAIIIVAVIGAFFIFFKPKIMPAAQIENPAAFIEKCMEDSAQGAISILGQQGGDIEPSHYFLYKGAKIRYLCYTNLNYIACTNQEPMLNEHVEQEIEEYVTPALKSCVLSIKADFEKRGYSVEADINNIALKTSIKTKNVFLNATFEFTASKGENTIKKREFSAVLKEPLYELIALTTEIINQEIKFGNFNIDGYMLLYSQHEVERNKVNEIKIYTLTDRATQRQFRFALRNYVMPAGI